MALGVDGGWVGGWVGGWSTYSPHRTTPYHTIMYGRVLYGIVWLVAFGLVWFGVAWWCGIVWCGCLAVYDLCGNDFVHPLHEVSEELKNLLFMAPHERSWYAAYQHFAVN